MSSYHVKRQQLETANRNLVKQLKLIQNGGRNPVLFTRFTQGFQSYRKIAANFKELHYQKLLGENLVKDTSFNVDGVFSHTKLIDPLVNEDTLLKANSCSVDFLQNGERHLELEQLVTALAPNRIKSWVGNFPYGKNKKTLVSGELVKGELHYPLSVANLHNCVVVDLETTTQNPLTGEIIEIGIVEIKGANPESWNTFTTRFQLSSESAKKIGTGPVYLHNITVGDLAKHPKITDKGVQEVLQKYLCSGKRIIAHGGFEFEWLSMYVDNFLEVNLDETGKQNLIDTFTLSKLVTSYGFDTPRSLKDIALTYGVEYRNAHSGLGDALATAKVASKMVELLNY